MRMPQIWRQYPLTRLLILGVLLPIVAYVAIFQHLLGPDGDEQPIRASTNRTTGIESHLVVVFVSASFCAANGTEGFEEGVKSVMAKLKERGPGLGYDRVHTIGLSVDVHAVDGIEYLSKFGNFTEIISGANWTNSGSIRYLLKKNNVGLVIPQIVILRRRVNRRQRGLNIIEEDVVAVLKGADRIISGLADVKIGSPTEETESDSGSES